MKLELKNILYAEDEADIRAIAQVALEDLGGFNVKYCKNGLEVLENIKNFTPDLLLLDVMMPNMDGPTTLKEVRKLANFANTPVIFMTARIQEEEINYYKSLGSTSVIAKPFDPMTLAIEIRKIWEKF